MFAYILRGEHRPLSMTGEPQGTAGLPVMDTMRKAGVVDAVVVATPLLRQHPSGGGRLIGLTPHRLHRLGSRRKIQMQECLLLSASCDYSLYGKGGGLVRMRRCGG